MHFPMLFVGCLISGLELVRTGVQAGRGELIQGKGSGWRLFAVRVQIRGES